MSYYTYGDTLIPNTVARSADLKGEFEAIETGLATLPTATELKLGTAQYGTEAGAANAYVVTLPYTPAAYVAGMVVNFRAANTNTGASTVNINAVGSRSIKRTDGTALQANDVVSGAMSTIVYNGTDFILTNGLPGAQAAAAASAAAALVSEQNARDSEIVAVAAGGSAEAARLAAEVAQLAAETAETNAATSESNAATSESNALSYRNAAEAAQTAAETAETNAELSETNAEAAGTAAVAAWDSFDDRYLGSKADDPALDNDGNALLTGALYWNSTSDVLKAYDGAAWQTAVLPSSDYLEKAGGSMSGDIDMENNDIVGVKTCVFEAEYDNGNSGASKTITLANGQKQKITLTAATELTISATGAATGHYQVRLIQDGTGGRAITWSGISSTHWLNSTSAPPINGAIDGESILTVFVSGGTIICASISRRGTA